MVVIAHDVDPIELILWMPHLCRNKDVPYCFVKSKARLGQFVNKKFATCVALTDVRNEDKAEVERLSSAFKSLYNKNEKHFIEYGDIVLGEKANRRNEIRQKQKEAEMIQNA